MKLLGLKFQQNHTISEDFDFWVKGDFDGVKGTSIYKFYSKLLLVNI